MIPQANATLTAVTRGGASEDYGTPAGAGPELSIGDLDVYYATRRATMQEASALNRVSISYALVPGGIGVQWQVGDVLTLRTRAGSVIERTVREVRERNIDSLPSQPTRLDFEEV